MKAEWNVIKITIHRYKLVYGLTAGYLAFLIACNLLTIVTPSGAVAMSVFYYLGLVACIGAFGHPEADLAVDRPALPPFLLRLPISTPSLALPPAIASGAVGFVGWMAYVKLFLEPVLRASSQDLPNLIWPATMLAALGPMLLALQWAPLTGKTRVLAITALPTLLIVGGIIWGLSAQGGGLALSLFFGAVAVASTFGAWGALAASRINGGANWTLRLRRNVKPRERRREMPNFRSPLAAQRWLEWNRQSKYLPIATTVILTCVSLLLLFPQPYGPSGFITDLYVRSDFLALAPSIMWLPVLFAIVFGLGARRSEARGAEGIYSPFFSTRPADSALLLRAKNQAGALAALAAWGISIAFLTLWSLVPAYVQTMPPPEFQMEAGRRVVQQVEPNPPIWAPAIWHIFQWASPAQIMSGIAFALLTLFLTWRCQAVGVVADCSRGRRGALRYAMGSISASVIGLMYLSSSTPNIYRDSASTERMGLLGCFLLVKLFAWFMLSFGFLGRRPQGGMEVARSIGTWALGSLFLTIGFSLFGASAILSEWHWAALPEVAVATFALTPLARPMMARNAIEAGRHA